MARFTLQAILVFFVFLPVSSAYSDHHNVECLSSLSDPDGDGWGWENDQSCVVTSQSLERIDPATETAEQCPDPDGDGWGWHNGRSCLVPSPDTIESSGSVLPQSGNLAMDGVQSDLPPYPQRDPFLIKAINTDHWQNRNDFITASTGGVAINLVWASWQPVNSTAPCARTQTVYQGYCFSIPSVFDEEIRYWSGRGLNVTGILWGVPAWARTDNCYTGTPTRDIFCTPQNPEDFARFAGMLAKRYAGYSGNGELHDFVIHNEVNMNDWYDHDCGQGIPCDQQRWIERYSADFNAAYDAIKREKPEAKVFVPLAHQFDESFDRPRQQRPVVSVKSFLRGVNARASGRHWQVAYHPYSKSLGTAGFSIDDLPHVTFGNIGVLASWLRQEFPNQPQSWEIYLTESGFNSVPPAASEGSQANALCKSFRNALATPGIENYIYHRMQDHPAEAAAGVGFGLRDSNGSAKQSWRVWSTASGQNGLRNSLDCGFEHLPYTRLSSYSHSTRMDRTSSRVVESGYRENESWYLNRNHTADSVMLYECQQQSGSYISRDKYCDGNTGLGPVGYAWLQPAGPTTLLQTCEHARGRYTSSQPECAEGSVVEVLGYARLSR